MRLFYLILLLLFVGAVVVFAVQNKDDVTIRYLDRSESYPFAAVVGVTYGLGMLTGWTVVGLLKRTFQRATERRE